MQAARGPTIFNLTLTNGGQEYSQLLQDGDDRAKPSLKKIQLRCTDNTSVLQYAYVPGGPYFTLKANEVYWEDGLESHNITLYIKSATAGAVAEIEVWY